VVIGFFIDGCENANQVQQHYTAAGEGRVHGMINLLIKKAYFSSPLDIHMLIWPVLIILNGSIVNSFGFQQ
jgi:hypothetical protein